jgi:hypothetical protein
MPHLKLSNRKTDKTKPAQGKGTGRGREEKAKVKP